MTRVVVIGIDSMDRLLLDRFADRLPVLTSLRRRSAPISMVSVFPPDSDTSWASIYTGLDPSGHGIVHFVDPLEKASIYQTDYLNSAAVQGKTFWDLAGRAGMRICLVTPHVGYPAWEINGVMVSRIPKREGFVTYPEDYHVGYDLRKLSLPSRIPDSKAEYPDYLGTCAEAVRNEFEFGKSMFGREDWDLFFIYSSALDFIQHIFWSFCDPDDPMYPGDDNPFRDAIADFYALYDSLIGDLLAFVGPDVPVIVMSDHGHAMRPTVLFNINEVLRQHGYLRVRGGFMTPVRKATETLKRSAVDLFQRTALRGTALKVLRKYPKVKEIYTTPSMIDFDSSRAWCTDLSGMKAYSYGGINLAKNGLDDGEYSRTKREIVDLLSEYTLPGENARCFRWVKDRDDVFRGPYRTKYPDLLFQLRDGLGAGWAVEVPLLTRAQAHNFFPGSHSGDSPVFLLVDPRGIKPCRPAGTLTDIAPTILDLMGVSVDASAFDGRSFFDGT